MCVVPPCSLMPTSAPPVWQMALVCGRSNACESRFSTRAGGRGENSLPSEWGWKNLAWKDHFQSQEREKRKALTQQRKPRLVASLTLGRKMCSSALSRMCLTFCLLQPHMAVPHHTGIASLGARGRAPERSDVPRGSLPAGTPNCTQTDVAVSLPRPGLQPIGFASGGGKVPEDQRKTQLNKQLCVFADFQTGAKDTRGEDSISSPQKQSVPPHVHSGGSETFPLFFQEAARLLYGVTALHSPLAVSRSYPLATPSTFDQKSQPSAQVVEGGEWRVGGVVGAVS